MDLKSLKLGDWVRQPAGSTRIIQCKLADRNLLSGHIQTCARRIGGRVQSVSINGFMPDAKPVYLLKVTVLKPGAPRKKRGRPSKAKE